MKENGLSCQTWTTNQNEASGFAFQNSGAWKEGGGGGVMSPQVKRGPILVFIERGVFASAGKKIQKHQLAILNKRLGGD